MVINMVINEHGGTEGPITLHDILEAVVGDLPAPGESPETHGHEATRRFLTSGWDHTDLRVQGTPWHS